MIILAIAEAVSYLVIYLSLSLSIYIYIYIHINYIILMIHTSHLREVAVEHAIGELMFGRNHIYIYIYIYIYVADSLDQPQLTTQKCTNCACELNKHIPYQSKKHRDYMNTNIPHTTPRTHTMLSWPASGYA